MSTENTPVAPDTDDLDAFDDLFHGRTKQVEADEEQASPESVEEVDEEVDALEPKDDTHADDEADDEEEEEAPKPKLSRREKRIEQLLEKNRLLEERLAAVEKNTKPVEQKQEVAKSAEPDPNDLNEDGSEKYPLGEFDPQYIRDLTKFALAEERAALKAEADEEKAQTEMQAQKNALHESWNGQLVDAQERYPDFQEKGQELLDTFEGIDARYGEYLEATIMSMDNGTDVFYYLASNPDEADKIVKSGPTKATIALGRLSARFDKEETPTQVRASKAPTPPPRNKGTAVSKSVPDDTDDLDAFAKKLFKK